MGKLNVHSEANFARIGTRSSHFVVSPEWVSEKVSMPKLMPRRQAKPWSYEFQGARTWPYNTVEERLSKEERTRRALLPGHVPNTNYTQYRRGVADLNHSYGLLVRRPDSALAGYDLDEQDKDVLHKATLIKLTDNGSFRPDDLRPKYSSAKRSVRYFASPTQHYQQQGYSTSYGDNYGLKLKSAHGLLDPNYAEYVDHEAVPPSRPRAFRNPTPLTMSLDRGSNEANPPTMYPDPARLSARPRVVRARTVHQPYSNFASHNWVH